MPAYLRYGSNPNVAPIVALPDNGWLVSEDGRVKLGNHGFDPTASDLCVPFRAEGPDFKHGYVRTELFDNTCIYPLLAQMAVSVRSLICWNIRNAFRLEKGVCQTETEVHLSV